MSAPLKPRRRPTDVRGPTGQIRPGHPTGAAVVVAQIATRQRKEIGKKPWRVTLRFQKRPQ